MGILTTIYHALSQSDHDFRVEAISPLAGDVAKPKSYSKEESEAAIAAARANATAKANVRLGAILAAPGIHEDASRMAAALDLAIRSPDMAAESVAAFVVKNIAAGGSSGLSYEQQRLADHKNAFLH